jgi:hypothetical protein
MDEQGTRVPPTSEDAAVGSRREFMRRAAYIAPALLTLAASPAMAQNGSRPPPPTCGPNEFPVWDPNTGMWYCGS